MHLNPRPLLLKEKGRDFPLSLRRGAPEGRGEVEGTNCTSTPSPFS